MHRGKASDSPTQRLPRKSDRKISPAQSRVLMNLFERRDYKQGFGASGFGAAGLQGAIGSLFRRGMLRHNDRGRITLTSDGLQTAADLKGGRI